MRTVIAAGSFSALCWALFFILFTKDRSRYRNCYALFLALASLFPLVVNLAGPYGKSVALVLLWGILLGILVVPFFLIHNGIVMIRREGRHLSQLLSLALGLAILAGEALVFAWVLRWGGAESPRAWPVPRAFLPVTAAVFTVTVIYLSFSFLLFMLYTLFLQIIPRKKDFDYVIIHGAGLLDGNRVSKLLSDRLDKAVEVYRQDPTPPRLIPSGGKGPDEDIPEARAMAEYLISKGIPEADIIPEDRSTTTLENLQCCQRILDTFPGRKYTALVTSNYHVYRALRYCRMIGLKCTGIGSHVAFYYWPSALIREYIAVHAEKKHLLLLVLGWLLCVVPLLAMIFRY